MENADDLVYLPIDLVRTIPVGLDIGSTISKILYRSKQDRTYNADPKLKLGKMRIKSITIPATDDQLAESVVAFLKENCDLDTSGKQVTAHVTGVQSGKVRERFLEELGIKLTILDEGQELVNGLCYLGQCDLPPEFVLHPLSEEAIKEANHIIGFWKPLMEPYVDSVHTIEAEPQQKITFPCLLTLIGSSTVLLEITEDGKMVIGDMTFKGGRTFQGLCKLLTGEENFEKIIEMALEGNYRNIDTTYLDIAPPISEDNPYSDPKIESLMDEVTAHIMGKVISTPIDAMDKKDILSSLLRMWVVDIAQFCHLLAQSRDIYRIYFCGSFIANKAIRHMLTKELAVRNGIWSRNKGHMDFQFLRHDSHVGAIGAYLNNGNAKETESEKKPEETKTAVKQGKKVME